MKSLRTVVALEYCYYYYYYPAELVRTWPAIGEQQWQRTHCHSMAYSEPNLEKRKQKCAREYYLASPLGLEKLRQCYAGKPTYLAVDAASAILVVAWQQLAELWLDI